MWEREREGVKRVLIWHSHRACLRLKVVKSKEPRQQHTGFPSHRKREREREVSCGGNFGEGTVHAWCSHADTCVWLEDKKVILWIIIVKLNNKIKGVVGWRLVVAGRNSWKVFGCLKCRTRLPFPLPSFLFFFNSYNNIYIFFFLFYFKLIIIINKGIDSIPLTCQVKWNGVELNIPLLELFYSIPTSPLPSRPPLYSRITFSSSSSSSSI